ncbi:HlyD family type I secretion periplasmic adaptor subunit [Aestuariivirga sp.]|uniref:HlyD family type I secretion periplasmic adaptor subunit n=1 Tax=Aestuariivirga sp. TaxID=2650926 RepID=UPI003593CBB7
MAAFSTDKSLRRFQIMGYSSAFVMIGVFGAWATTTELHGAIIAPATIIAETNSKRVQQKDGGVVRKILVRDGDRVTEGQELVILDDTETKAELGIVDALLVEELAKKSRLEAQRDENVSLTFPDELLQKRSDPKIGKVLEGQEKLHAARLAAVKGKIDQLNEQVGQVGEQIEGISAQIKSKDRQIELIKDELSDLQTLLDKGLTPQSRVLAMQREQARLEGERGELIGSRAAASSKAGEIKLQILQIREEVLSQTLLDLREADGRIAELSERKLAARARLDRMVVKAPITGTVYQLMVHTEGGVVTPAEPLMMIVPEADDLVLQAQVMPQNIEQITMGQKAQIRFPAFNSRTTPEVQAEVFSVSADVSRMSADTPPFYDVRLRIPHDQLALLGTSELKPGMPAEAFIQTTSRTPMSYFMKPLMDQFQHTWRER